MSPEAVNLIRGKKLDPDLVKRLKTALRGAEALLVDAELKQFEDPHVKNWLIDLQDAVYNAGDSLDHVFTKAAIQNKASTSWTDLFNFKDREMENKMVNKMEGEVRRIEDLLVPEHIPGLKEVTKDNSNYSSWRTPATSLVKGNIYGREDDQKAIIKIINDGSDRELSVIPIVGMGGVGKTTLAQWVYNNEDLKGFALKAWVCISEDFDIIKVTKMIMEEITKKTCDTNNFNRLQLDLKEKLSNNKFLIVLDDVWSEDGDIWNNFRTPFKCGAKGSTILVTTRSQDVASVVQTCVPYLLKELSDDYCWSVFVDNACLTESNSSPALEEIGRKIVKKCKGLPLAAETHGCSLRRKLSIEEWTKVLKSDIWEIPLKKSKIIPVLLISYYHLPAHLKGCFVYCSLFPKDHEFVKDNLILLWMAEDLLSPPKSGETLEEVGNECFDNLASRLFFKQHSDKGKSFVMHDLLHDLAMFLAGDFYCRLEELGEAERISIHTRHLSYRSLSHSISKNVDKLESLRTFLQVNFWHQSFSVMPDIILSKLEFLRVLSFRSFDKLDLLLDSIGKLVHLRYLDLSFSKIKTLPESLCGLYNLQTLKLFGCDKLKMLPRGMCNMVNLRHLDIGETRLKEIPRGMSKLKHLHLYLDHFAVGTQKDSAKINELGELSTHGGTLELRNLENVADCNEAMGARLMDKTYLDSLIFKWTYDADFVSNTQTERDIFDKLQPHHGVNELEIYWHRGTRFPNWVGHCSYNNMSRVTLKNCTSCCMLPPLGKLPSLKSLSIEYFVELERIGVEFYKNEDDPSSSSASPFPSLENLTFEMMPRWEVWSPFDSNNAFPKLKSLRIIDCPKLKGDLLNHLPALMSLSIGNCRKLLSDLSSMGESTSLTRFEIDGDESIKSFPNEGLLPRLPSLTTLILNGFQNLETLESKELLHLTSLQKLKIRCPKLKSIEGERLPDSLSLLEIDECPLLAQRCKMKDEQIWPKISHIPNIQFDQVISKRKMLVLMSKAAKNFMVEHRFKHH